MTTKETKNTGTAATDQLEREPDRLDDEWVAEPGSPIGSDATVEDPSETATTLESVIGSVQPPPRRFTSNRDTAYIVEWSADVQDAHLEGGFDPDRILRQRSI